MKREKSCGALVCRKVDGQIQTLLIENLRGKHWGFPKGHMEGQETELETAAREIREETGLHVTPDSSFRHSVSYLPHPDVMKEVVYFIAFTDPEQPVRAQQEEVSDCRWCSFDEAAGMLTFDKDKQVLAAARAFLAC